MSFVYKKVLKDQSHGGEKRISDLFPAENQRKNAGNCKRRGAGTLAARGRHALVPDGVWYSMALLISMEMVLGQ